ncbi:MAG: hypothetical protein R6U26_01150 [Candidatus Undinarchaeales archaeon]
MVSIEIALVAIGAGIAVGAAGLSSGIGAGIAGAAGAGAISEDPKKFSTALIFQALPQTQGIYGFLIAILILMGTGLLGGGELINLGMGNALMCVGAGIAVGVAGLSAVGQGIASGSAIGAAAEKEEMFGKGMVFSVLPETQAIYGMLIAILILLGAGILGGGAIAEISPMYGLIGVGAGLAVGVAGLSAIGQGIAAGSSVGVVAEKEEMFGKGMVFSVLPETQAIYGMLIAILILLGAGILGGGAMELTTVAGMIAIGAGVSIGVAGLSGIGQGIASGASINAVSEKPEVFGRGMVFSVLPETQALYGFIIAILLLATTGLIGGAVTGEMELGVGLAAIGAGASVGLAGLSAIGQGIVSGGAVGAAAKNPETTGRGLVLSVIPETYAIFGLLIAILIMLAVGLFG